MNTKKKSAIPSADEEADFEPSEFDDDGDNDTDKSVSESNTQSQEETKEIAASENRAVVWSRALVIVVLIGAATATGLLTYYFTRSAETDEFEGDVS